MDDGTDGCEGSVHQLGQRRVVSSLSIARALSPLTESERACEMERRLDEFHQLGQSTRGGEGFRRWEKDR